MRPHGHVLILAGGGGHTGEAYALAQELHGKANLSFLVPEADTLSKAKLSRFGKVNTLILPRGPKTPHRQFIPKLFQAFIHALRKISKEFDVVVSHSSNFCIAPALVAWAKGIPVVNVENSVRFVDASTTAKILQCFSKVTALEWEEQKKFLKGIVVGPLIQDPEVKPWNGKYVLVTGGTHGHKLLFDVIAQSKLKNVFLQTGEVDPEPYVRMHPEWKIIRYSDRFSELIAGAKVVVTHFGFTALEALSYKKPIVIVGNPEWTRAAGFEDAKVFAEKINASLVLEVTLENVLDSIKKAEGREVPTLPDGAKALAKIILNMC